MVQRIRLTYFFHSNFGGWSEAVHSSLTAANLIAQQSETYINARLPLLSNDNQLIHVRVSDDVLKRDLLFFSAFQPRPGQYISNAAPPAVSLVYVLSSGNVIRRNLFIRGVPYDAFSGENLTPNAFFKQQMDVFNSMLKTNNLSIAAKTITNPVRFVTTMTPGDGGLTTDQPVTGVTVGSTIQVLNFSTTLLPRRYYRVYAMTSESAFKLANWPATVNLVQIGSVRLRDYTLYPVNDAVADHVGERKVGRPFGLPAGRS